MGDIIFEGAPPYDRLRALSTEARPLIGDVEVVVTVAVDGLDQPTVPIRLVLGVAVARALAGQIEPAAKTAELWDRNL